MTGIPFAAILLALSLLTLPAPGRPAPGVPRVRRRRVPVLCAAALPAVVAAVVLPGATTLSAAVAVATALVRVARTARRRRVSGEAEVLIGALDVLVGELRIGAHPVAAVEAAARESAGPVATALWGIAARARLGGDTVSALSAGIPGSLLGAEWSRLVVAWRLAAEHGIPIGAVMRAAQTDIVERQRFRQKVQSALAGARASAGILAALPVAGLALGQAIGADPVRFLIGGGVGGWCLLAGVLLLAAGLLWADRIIDRVGT